MAKETPTAHIMILPSPGMGHLIPLVELAKQLVRHQLDISVTFIIPNSGPPSKAETLILNSFPPSISYSYLPPVDLTDVPEASGETHIFLTVTRSLPSLRHYLDSLSSKKELPVALVVDPFFADAFEVAKDFGISPYLFFPSTAQLLSFGLYFPELDETTSGEFKDMLEPVRIPGSMPVMAKEFPHWFQDRNDPAYKAFLSSSKKYKLADGILLNSFSELETEVLRAIQENPENPPVYPVGPLVNTGSSGDDRVEKSECLSWLDDKPHGSVLFVCFGSGGILGSDQIKELALGLEMSQQNFLLVIRRPNDAVSSATFFDFQNERDPYDFLPDGFMDRTKDRGLVITSWAPQAEILRHGSTGGFLTHCGWNSTLEAVVNGVPLIAWPLYAEQKLNALSLCDSIKVALRPKANESGVIEKEEIARVIKDLMEGDEGKRVRNRMKYLKDAAVNGVGEDGSSTKPLSQVALKWKTN